MPDRRRRNCMCCGKPSSEAGPISWLGNCRSCGKELLTENVEGLQSKSGPAHRRWLRGYAKMLDKATP